MIIDLHNHTVSGSFDAKIEMHDLFALAQKFQIDGIGITEHDSTKSLSLAHTLSKKMNLSVFDGIEVTTEKCHLLIYGNQEIISGFESPTIKIQVLRDIINQLSDNETTISVQKLSRVLRHQSPLLWKVEELLADANSKHCASILAHPFWEYKGAKDLRYLYIEWAKESSNMFDMSVFIEYVKRNDPEIYYILQNVDAIEVYNGGARIFENRLSTLLAKEIEKPMVGGSDTHTEGMACICGTEFQDEVTNTNELVNAIKKGRVKPKYIF